ncbi:class I lanthipeptide [uncultured Dokdonia sp.]|uniref:class I lanthipeptide n=1 Tax=uncultured Dokdonia sp. TaxID=575653 RepID=UPI00262BAA21|nr:class I lanthipeptide [uncultured Dokdonia sp.]
MKKSNQDSKLQFQKANIANLNNPNLYKIKGGESQEPSDSVSWTVIRSGFKCDELSLTTSG